MEGVNLCLPIKRHATVPYIMKIRNIDTSREPETVLAIASAYQQAFGHAPWNEGFICQMCSSKYPLSHPSKHCSQCDNTDGLAEYWPKDKILHDFSAEMSNQGSVCVVAEEKSEVVGFAWGYNLTISKESSRKLNSPNLHTLVSGNILYLDEVAVVPAYQGKGVGKKLMEAITPTGDKVALLRTLEQSPMQHLALNLGWRKIVSISEGRIIMATNL